METKTIKAAEAKVAEATVQSVSTTKECSIIKKRLTELGLEKIKLLKYIETLKKTNKQSPERTNFEKEQKAVESEIKRLEKQLKALKGESKAQPKSYISVTAKDSDVKKAIVDGSKKLAFNVKLAKKCSFESIHNMLIEYQKKQGAAVSFIDHKEIAKKIFSVLQLNKENLIKIVLSYQPKVDSVICKTVTLSYMCKVDPSKDIDNMEKYKESLLYGKRTKARGFVGFNDYKGATDKPVMFYKEDEISKRITGYIKAEDNYSILAILLVIVEYLKAGSPSIESLDTLK